MKVTRKDTGQTIECSGAHSGIKRDIKDAQEILFRKSPDIPQEERIIILHLSKKEQLKFEEAFKQEIQKQVGREVSGVIMVKAIFLAGIGYVEIESAAKN